MFYNPRCPIWADGSWENLAVVLLELGLKPTLRVQGCNRIIWEMETEDLGAKAGFDYMRHEVKAPHHPPSLKVKS